jgi:hypothetical protein
MIASSATNRGNGNGPAPTETHPMSQHTTGQGTLFLQHLPGPPTTRKRQPHDIDVAPSGPHIDEASAAKHDWITLLLQLFPALLHAIAGAVSSCCSGSKGCSPKPSEQPMTSPPPILNHRRPSLTKRMHTSLRQWWFSMPRSGTSTETTSQDCH